MLLARHLLEALGKMLVALEEPRESCTSEGQFMSATMKGAGTAGRFSLPIAKACPSSWISWVCYWLGFVASNDGALMRDLMSGGARPFALLAAIGVFFASVVAIQRHMRLSILANSYGTPQNLVTSGPFRYSRNPIYVAFLVPIASLGCTSVPVALLTGVVYILVMNARVIRGEERVLETQFGAQYRRYVQSVPRWLF